MKQEIKDILAKVADDIDNTVEELNKATEQEVAILIMEMSDSLKVAQDELMNILSIYAK